jgi:hypothetical protein
MPGKKDRIYWLNLAERLSKNVLEALDSGNLRKTMPVERVPGSHDDRAAFSHLEAFGRLMAGLAPWLELKAGLELEEEALRTKILVLALGALDQALDPASPDCLNFSQGDQPLVDAAFLSSALLRAPKTLMAALRGKTRERLISALQSTRQIKAPLCNWLYFAAMVEAALAHLGADWIAEPIDKALSSHEEWYLGDGTYGDGPDLAWDYYNSYVIHPMSLEVLEAIEPYSAKWKPFREKALLRAQRFAEVLERMISPEGAYPPLGRSISYRAGAFHLLSYLAWKKLLPGSLSPAQIRCALTAVLKRQMEAPGTFDADGWLRLGFFGHQPGLAEFYISTGSLYLVALVLLPLGLGPDEAFWSEPDQAWTSKKLWSGENMAPDKALDS